jgi:two-component system KDP operon response regulator KdpE
MPNLRALVIDDDPEIVDTVRRCFKLRWPDAKVIEANDADSALERFADEEPDVVILDLTLGGRSGFEVCARIREKSTVPLIILTARSEEMNKVRGLELGADDYITKPFSHLEFIARVRAILRRAAAGPIKDNEPAFEKGPLKFDFAAHRVLYDGRPVSLTPTEYNLLYHLTKSYPSVVPHRTLLSKVWGTEYVNESEYVKVHVQRIRSKFSRTVAGADPITNERGVGYRLNI